MKNVTFQGLLALTLLMAVAVSNSAHACSVALVPTVCQGGSPLDFVGTGDSVAIQTFGYVASNGAKKACSDASASGATAGGRAAQAANAQQHRASATPRPLLAGVILPVIPARTFKPAKS